jgi:hypothetical protein
MGSDIIKFVCGSRPFEPLDENGTAMVYCAGPGDEVNQSYEAQADDWQGTGRFQTRDPETLDKMMAGLLMLLQGPL